LAQAIFKHKDKFAAFGFVAVDGVGTPGSFMCSVLAAEWRSDGSDENDERFVLHLSQDQNVLSASRYWE